MFVGQKVECIYYHEYDNESNRYQRPIIQRLLDKPFKPVKFGVITGDAGTHPYWLADSTGQEQYLFVKFEEYLFDKAIPISCIQDAVEAAESTKKFLSENEHRIGEKGYSLEAFNALSKKADEGLRFAKKD